MTKPKGIRKFELTAPGVSRPVMLEIDEQARSLRMYEKRSRTKFQLGTAAVFKIFIQIGKEIRNAKD